MTYREVVRKLSQLGCHEIPRNGGGSHRKWHNPSLNRSTVIPDWGGRDLKTGTARGIVRQLGLDWTAFEAVRSYALARIWLSILQLYGQCYRNMWLKNHASA